jgi:esterase/lipase superfamily enzyme
MLLSLILASQFWLMSDRASFWDAEKISDRTEWMKGPIFQESILDLKEVKGKNVLLLVHGYNNSVEDALSTYRLVNVHVCAFRGYDVVIGYLWPGDDCPLQYYDARRHAAKLATTMRSHLELLAASASRIDVLAHSMGNRLMFEALKLPSLSPKKLIHHFYSIAAAVGSETLEPNQQYYSSTQNCEKIFVFYSKRDEVLKWSYSLAEWDEALGYEGARDPKKLPPNVQLINDTKLIGQHSQYFGALPVYDFIKAQFASEKHHQKR